METYGKTMKTPGEKREGQEAEMMEPKAAYPAGEAGRTQETGSSAIPQPDGDKRRSCKLSREEAVALLKKYNKDAFHIQHAYTVEGVMRYFANELGFAREADYWSMVGLLHDIDFELYPDQHCQKAPELLREAGVGEDMIYSICSHGYGICSDLEPLHLMEKVLYAADELTGLVWSAALMRPSRSTKDMELKSLKKKFKDKRFAAGCSRDVIAKGAERLGWDLDTLLEKTILAMRDCEDDIAAKMGQEHGSL